MIERSELWTDLVSGEDAERGHDLLGRVCRVSCLARHEVQESFERDAAEVVGIDRRHYALEVRLALHNQSTQLDSYT